MKKTFSLLLLSIFMCFHVFSQNTISGYVYNIDKEPLEGASILVPKTDLGTSTDKVGYFELSTTDNVKEIMVSYIGFSSQLIDLGSNNSVSVYLIPMEFQSDEIVISASRLSEELKTTPITIQKIGIKQLENPTSGDYFQSLGNLRDVEIINNSLGFKIFNTRGFNSTAQVRAIQLLDGVDNQLPTINIVPGNMFGISDIDIRSIEVLSGPASAMYGPNAMQGVISYESKNPYDFEGVSAQLKGGNREYMDAQLRIAKTFLNDKLGVKIVSSYMKAHDWQSDYIYGNQLANPNIQMNIMGKMLQDPSYAGFVNYLNNVDPNTAPFTKVVMPGYSEEDLFDGNINNFKFSGSLHYRFQDDMELSYTYRYGTGTALFMGNNRAPLDGFMQQQNAIKFKGKGFTFNAYRSDDNTNDTYTLVGAGVNLGFASLGSVDAMFLPAYVSEVERLSNSYNKELTPDEINQAVAAGNAAAANSWLEPGSDAFNQAYEQIKSNTPPSGAHYKSKTTLYHIDGAYNYSFKSIDLSLGGSFRNTSPVSQGTVFSDTLLSDGTYKSINVSEYGGFVQGIGHLLNDNVKLYGSIRMDKSDNYNWQFSPRIAVVSSVNKHHIRLSAQSAFRAPVLADQYQYLNRGADIVLGNINDFSNCYSQSSIDQFYANGMDPTILSTTIVNAVKPEQLKTLEIGYTGSLIEKLHLDFSAYFNEYSDFIAYKRVGQPRTGLAGESSGLDAMMSRNYQKYSVATNIDQDVNTYGFSIGLVYYINTKLKVYGNYTFSEIDTNNIDNDVIPGFNTPKHKINLGLEGIKIYKNLGFGINWKWVDDYYWEAVFASGPVPTYNTLDVQFNYEIPKIYSTFKLGGTNILGDEYIQAYAMPKIGAFWYASVLFDLNY